MHHVYTGKQENTWLGIGGLWTRPSSDVIYTEGTQSVQIDSDVAEESNV